MSELKELQQKSADRKKVEVWLDSIHETDQQCRAEVLAQCAIDKDAREYYVTRHDTECKIISPH